MRRRPVWRILIWTLMTAFVLLCAWLYFRPAPVPAARLAAANPGVERLVLKIVSTRPHDPGAFTQGLVWHQGMLYESTGQYGGSSLRQVDPVTGEVRRRLDLPESIFAEGLALVGNRLFQITWQEEVAFVYSLDKFERTGELRYDGEGWGLCYDGKHLVMSDGSDRLTFRDPRTFEVVREVRVRLGQTPMDRLNELECTGGSIWANVWQTEEILKISPKTGKVQAVVDASGLLSPQERAGTDVLNGIAYDPKRKTFLITGKMWPKLFEVRFVRPPTAPSETPAPKP